MTMPKLQKRQTSPIKQAAFTLIELLIAMVIFSILAVMAYGGLRAVMDSTVSIRENVNELDQLQRAYLMIERDLKQMIPRASMTEFGDLKPAVMSASLSDYDIEFTRGGRMVFGGREQSSLIRVAYVLDEEKMLLKRLYWNHVDRLTADEPLEVDLLEQVESIQFKYLKAASWRETWGESSSGTYYTTPEAVEVTLKHKSWGEIVRVFEVNG